MIAASEICLTCFMRSDLVFEINATT